MESAPLAEIPIYKVAQSVIKHQLTDCRNVQSQFKVTNNIEIIKSVSVCLFVHGNGI